jgi:hypothetical protein
MFTNKEKNDTSWEGNRKQRGRIFQNVLTFIPIHLQK